VCAGFQAAQPERQRHVLSVAWHDRRVVHLLLYGLLAIVLAAGLFVVAARFLPAGEQIAPPLRDEPPWELPPDRALHPEDVDSVRLPVALRGYRFAETDILLDRLAGELRSRDLEILRLRGEAVEAADDVAPLDGHHVAPDGPDAEVPVGDPPVNDVAVEDGPAEAAPVQDAPAEAAPVQDGPADGPPVEDEPGQHEPGKDEPGKDEPGDERA
jgi:hypothetical protein